MPINDISLAAIVISTIQQIYFEKWDFIAENISHNNNLYCL